MKVNTVQTKTDFLDYFPVSVDYPSEKVFNPLPMNELWCYVSSSYLDGFINYVEIVKGFVISHYRGWDKPLRTPVKIDIRVAGEWRAMGFTTKREIFNAVTTQAAVIHPKLSDFKDDVLILAKAFNVDKNEFCWVFYWYDCDVSDCSIGRFKTKDPDSAVIEKFTEYVKTLDCTLYGEPEQEIPLSHLNCGWKSF